MTDTQWLTMTSAQLASLVAAINAGSATIRARGIPLSNEKGEPTGEEWFAPAVEQNGMLWVYNPKHDFGFAKAKAAELMAYAITTSEKLIADEFDGKAIEPEARPKKRFA
jgi:hypothetical protein